MLDLLQSLGIQYEAHYHEPVFTCEEANLHTGHLPGCSTKNLFVRDKKGKRHILIVVDDSKTVNLNELAKLLDCSKLSMASPERLMTHLGIAPGSVSLLALINDKQHAVEVILDKEVSEATLLQCHPLTNTATLLISQNDMSTFFAHTQHEPRILEIPSIG
ncbi:MAG: prolyl-tRNA synthetase associated domain-containing protein [Bdellovibrionales bacterium]|nr:prolyl-tRNA synthetase associated domain-containing protein [Bdellovibrionales bacterium]